MSSEEPVGYFRLIRSNTAFRRLWIGNIISLFGDWFNTIALYSLILNLTGSEFALGAVFITKMLPWALASPLAGLIVDRFDRRRVMISADLLRAVIVLGLLFVDEVDEIYLVYVITALQVIIGAAFHPAQSASIPNITEEKELVTANTIMSATWSMLLTLGAAVGGLAVEWVGIQAVFAIDSASYLLSAFFIFRTVIPKSGTARATGVRIGTALREVVDGWRHLTGHPRIGRIALAKASWAVGGGALVYMLALLGEAVSPERGAAGIGILYAARGFGTGVGPVIARATFRNRSQWPAILGSCVIFSGMCYLLVAGLPWTWWVAVPVIVAHASSGANWVFSTVMLQERAIDEFRGRVFASEWLLIMLADSVSILIASLVLQNHVLDLRQAIFIFAGIQVLTGVFWLFRVVPREKNADRKINLDAGP